MGKFSLTVGRGVSVHAASSVGSGLADALCLHLVTSFILNSLSPFRKRVPEKIHRK